jgi:hypothetical protein
MPAWQDMQAFSEAIYDYLAGNPAPLWAWVGKILGCEPDARVREVLEKHYLPHGEHLPYAAVMDVLGHHRRRLKANSTDVWYVGEGKRVYRLLNKNPSWRLMRSLEGYGDPSSRCAALQQMLPGEILQAEADGYFGGQWGDQFLRRAVEEGIIETNRPLRQTRERMVLRGGEEMDKILSYDALPEGAGTFSDPDALDPYDGIEDGSCLGVLIEAGLPEQQKDIFRLLLQGLSNTEISARLGIPRNQVNQQKHRVIQKIRKYRLAAGF